jgi:hypothetical protein
MELVTEQIDVIGQLGDFVLGTGLLGWNIWSYGVKETANDR